METKVEKFNLRDMIHRELNRLQCRQLELKKEEDREEDYSILRRFKSEYKYLVEKIELWEAALSELLNIRKEISLLKDTVNAFRTGSFMGSNRNEPDDKCCRCPYHANEPIHQEPSAAEELISQGVYPEEPKKLTLEQAYKNIMDNSLTVFHLQTLFMLEQMHLSSGWEYTISGDDVVMSCTYPDRNSEKKMEYNYHFEPSRKHDFLWRLRQITKGELEEYDPELMDELYDVRRCVRETPDAARYVYRFMPKTGDGEEWRICKRCGFTVLRTECGENDTSNESGYTYQCFTHDEDLFSFETSRRANKYVHLAEVIGAVNTYKADLEDIYAVMSYAAEDPKPCKKLN